MKRVLNFVPTWEALAARLSVSGFPVTRRTIQEWRKDPRFKDDCPKDRADGRHDVTAWLEFMVRNCLKRADEVVGRQSTSNIQRPTSNIQGRGTQATGDELEGMVQPPLVGGCEADWKRAERALRVQQIQREISIVENTLLVAAELELPLGATFVALTNKMTQFPERAAPQVTGFTDVQEVIGILRAEIESDLRYLNAAEYLHQAPEEIAKELPFDEQTSQLMDALTFGGQDQDAFLALVAVCVREVLRRIGARAIAETTSGPGRTGEILNAKTGQVSEEAEDAQRAVRTGVSCDRDGEGSVPRTKGKRGKLASARGKSPGRTGRTKRQAKKT